MVYVSNTLSTFYIDITNACLSFALYRIEEIEPYRTKKNAIDKRSIRTLQRACGRPYLRNISTVDFIEYIFMYILEKEIMSFFYFLGPRLIDGTRK
jgi:hypothetical protein